MTMPYDPGEPTFDQYRWFIRPSCGWPPVALFVSTKGSIFDPFANPFGLKKPLKPFLTLEVPERWVPLAKRYLWVP
jgi:hypothetical protein